MNALADSKQGGMPPSSMSPVQSHDVSPTSGIPRIVILDENQVYAHYMRRLNREWSRRIKASRRKTAKEATRSQAKTILESRARSRSPILRKRSESVVNMTPDFTRGTTRGHRPRHQHHARSSGIDRHTEKVQEGERSPSAARPRSAPVVVQTVPHAKWVELRDRSHAARGPGPTSLVFEPYHSGDNGERRREHPSARPDSAPPLCKCLRQRSGVSTTEREQLKSQRASAWLAPGKTQFERDTQQLIRACNSKGTGKSSSYDVFWGKRKARSTSRHGCNRRSRRSQSGKTLPTMTTTTFGPDEKMEDLGRGAVVRLIGHLGMGRYAHRFRAFGVTGSDLASCTEEDLVQLGICFRPHRLRLLSEIRRWKRAERRESSADVSGPQSFEETLFDRPNLSRKPSNSANNAAIIATRHQESDYAELALATSSAPHPQVLSRNVFDTEHITETRRGNIKSDPNINKAALREDAVHPREHTAHPLRCTARSWENTPGSPEDAPRSQQNEEHASIVVVDSPRHSASTTTPVWDRNEDLFECTRQSLPSDGAGLEFRRQAEAASSSFQYPAFSTAVMENDDGRENRGQERNNGDDVECMQQELDGTVTTLNLSRRGNVFDKNCLEARTKDEVNTPGDEHEEAITAVSASCTPPANFPSSDIASKIKGTLHISDVRDVDIRVSFGRKLPFLQVRTCNQLVRIEPVNGAESVSANIGLSFRVTGEDLATGGVLIELCDDGNSTKNPVATGEATLQLLRCSGSTVEAHPADGPSIGAAANSTNSGIDTEVRLFAKAGGRDLGVCTVKLLFRPDGTDNIDPNVDAAEVANGANALGKTWANTLANEVPPTEVPQEDTVTATEKRQSSLLLTQAARHIEEVARHMEAIDQNRQLTHRGNDQDIDSHTQVSAIDGQEKAETCTTYPPVEKSPSGKNEDEAATAIQSYARRRAANKVANRRAREHTAATRVQSIVRRKLAVSATDRARERKLERVRQRRGEAAVRLQSAARHRLATIEARRLRDKEVRVVKGKQDMAAGQIQGFLTRKIESIHHREVERKRAIERDQAAIKLQCVARRQEAKAAARRCYDQKKKPERREKEQANEAAARIQTFTRRRMREEERRMVEAESRYKAAVKLQSVARGRGAKTEAERRKKNLSVENAASTFVEGVQCHVIESLARPLEQKRHQSAIKLQKLARARAQCKVDDMAEVRERNAAARRIQALGRRRLVANERRRALEHELSEAEERLARTVEKKERAARKLQRTARRYNSRKRVDSLGQRNAEAVAATSWKAGDSAGNSEER